MSLKGPGARLRTPLTALAAALAAAAFAQTPTTPTAPDAATSAAAKKPDDALQIQLAGKNLLQQEGWQTGFGFAVVQPRFAIPARTVLLTAKHRF